MQAVVYERHGGPEVLEVRDVPEPVPGDGEVLVDVEAIGVNFRDIYEREREGYGSTPPAIVGAEAAGTVVGSGERLAWTAIPSSYAERVAVDRSKAVVVPDGVSSEVAAAALLQGMTAHYLCHDSYPVQPGDWVVVHAAAGGVGLLLTQLVKLRGGHVLATTSTDEKAQLARGAGADEVARYETFAARARELTGGGGVAAVFDGVGRTTFDDGLASLRPLGSMIVYGAASGEPEPLDVRRLAAGGSLYVQRPTLQTYNRTPELLQARAAALFALIADGRLDVRIGGRYELAEARRAHEDLVARRTTGKLLLIP
jgi:NADPH2:quinone reductase